MTYQPTEKELLFHSYGFVFALEQVMTRLKQGEEIQDWAQELLDYLPRNPDSPPENS